MKSHDPFSRQKSSYYHLFDRFYFLFYLTQSFFFESQWHTNEHDDEHMKTVIEWVRYGWVHFEPLDARLKWMENDGGNNLSCQFASL